VELKPLGDRVVVRPLEQEERTAGGIVLPDTAKERPKRGEVIAVGPGKVTDAGQRIPVSLSAGDEVVFASYAGTEVKVDGQELLIMAESEVLAVIQKEG